MTSSHSLLFLSLLRCVSRLIGRSRSRMALFGIVLTPAVFAAAPVITSPLTASGHKGVPFSYQIAASGNPTKYNSTLMAGGLGVGFLSGTVSGVPTSEGTFSGEITATNADGTGSATLVVTIGPPLATQPVITSPRTALAVLGRPFSYQIAATNTPTSFDSSDFGNGLSWDFGSGVLSGIPTRSSGLVAASIRATNAVGTGFGELMVVFAPETTVLPVILAPTTATVVVGESLNLWLSTTGAPVLFDATGLPPGASLAPNLGHIEGTPTMAGVYSVDLSATNAAGTAHGTLTLTVNEASDQIPVITSPPTATATAGQPFTYRITASNAPDRFAVEGDVPGLGIVFATGVISGTCVEIGVYPLTISATNAAGTGEATLVLTVEPAPIPKPVITSPSAATTIAGRTFRYQITADHGPTWFGADDLPYGLVFDPIIGVISGRPWYFGDYTIPLRASNLGGTGLGSLALSVVVTADTYIAWAWARDLTGPGSAEGDDRDQDGLINLLEFALATDPFRSSSLQAPQGGFDPGSRSLLLTHRRTRTAQVVWTYETSSDLVTWSVCAPTITVLLSDADGDGSAEVVRAALPVAAAEGRRFLRVSVSEP